MWRSINNKKGNIIGGRFSWIGPFFFLQSPGYICQKVINSKIPIWISDLLWNCSWFTICHESLIIFFYLFSFFQGQEVCNLTFFLTKLELISPDYTYLSLPIFFKKHLNFTLGLFSANLCENLEQKFGPQSLVQVIEVSRIWSRCP